MFNLETHMTEISGMSQQGPKMLIVDDDPSIVRLLANRCTRMGFEVETAANGIQALLKAKRSKPDILVIDVNMPEVDGLSVCAHLLDPARRALDVIVVTGNRDAETLERCEGFGARYARKGPHFWTSLTSALAEIFPGREGKIRESATQPSAAEVRARPRVLLVDDDPEVGMFLASRLRKHGVDALLAPDAAQGYRMACREEPSVIVSDYFMPNGDAHYLLSRLRDTPATANIPFIVLSGVHFDELTEQNLLRGIFGHPGAAYVFKKSLDNSELFEALQKFCSFSLPSPFAANNSATERVSDTRGSGL
jgi:CheY-like chemotaxis protein